MRVFGCIPSPNKELHMGEEGGEAGRLSYDQVRASFYILMQHVWPQPKDKQGVPDNNTAHGHLILLK